MSLLSKQIHYLSAIWTHWALVQFQFRQNIDYPHGNVSLFLPLSRCGDNTLIWYAVVFYFITYLAPISASLVIIPWFVACLSHWQFSYVKYLNTSQSGLKQLNELARWWHMQASGSWGSSKRCGKLEMLQTSCVSIP
jgi:hypothetical protein